MFGKVFVYEDDNRYLEQYAQELETFGFDAFGSSNLYAFLQYAKEITPDIVIMNLHNASSFSPELWNEVKRNLCSRNKCPQIYLNTEKKFENEPQFPYYNFKATHLEIGEIIKIISETNPKNHLN